jgi:2-oxoisovalerate dehydrogenase E1 component beta subunit
MAEITYLEAIREALFEEMERDENVFCLGEDIGAYGGAFKVTEGLMAKFGESRVIDSPISEIAIVGAAAGAAHMGMRPVVEMQFIDFIANAYDMLTNYVATARYRAFLPTPMVVRGPSGGYVRGGPFHSQNPEAGFIHTPGLKVVYPATAEDAKGLMKAAIRDDDCVLFFEHKYLYRRAKGVMPAGDHVVPFRHQRLAQPQHVAALILERRLRQLEVDLANVRVENDEAAQPHRCGFGHAQKLRHLARHVVVDPRLA